MLILQPDDQDWGDELRRRRARGLKIDLQIVPRHIAAYAQTGLWPSEYRSSCRVDQPDPPSKGVLTDPAWQVSGPIRRRLIAFCEDRRRRGSSVVEDNPGFDGMVRTIEDTNSGMD